MVGVGPNRFTRPVCARRPPSSSSSAEALLLLLLPLDMSFPFPSYLQPRPLTHLCNHLHASRRPAPEPLPLVSSLALDPRRSSPSPPLCVSLLLPLCTLPHSTRTSTALPPLLKPSPSPLNRASPKPSVGLRLFSSPLRPIRAVLPLPSNSNARHLPPNLPSPLRSNSPLTTSSLVERR